MAYIEDYLNIKTAWAAGFSPDASKALVQSNLGETMQLYSIGASGGELRQITDEKEPVSGFYLPTDDELILSIDEGGNERLQLYRMPDTGGPMAKVVHDPEHIHRAGGVTRDGKMLAYATNRRNGVDFDVVVRDLASGEERTAFDIGGWCQPGPFSPDGRFVSVMRLSEKPADNDIYLVDLTSEEVLHISPHEDPAEYSLPQWVPDGSSFWFSANEDREFAAVARYDMGNRTWEYVLEDEWDLSCQVDWAGRNLLVTANEDGFTTIRLHDPRSGEPRGRSELPGRGVAGGSLSRDGTKFGFSFTSFVEPGDAWVTDLRTGELTRLTTSPCPVPRETFRDAELHRFSSFDGEQIPCWVVKPEGIEGPPPVVVNVHGGPESQSRGLFNPLTQYLVARGYAVVSPNVRGSTGYGRRYQSLDDVKKRLDSVRDLESLHAWLPSVGLDQRRAVLMGGSYGGYMVLAGLAFQPDLWAGGVDVVGISSLVTFLENTSAWRRKFREREYGSLEHDRDFLIEASPITHVDEMEAPLFIIHGRNDPRVPVTEAEQIYEVLKGKGIRTEMFIYDDEGHGLAKLKNRLDAYPKVADFLDEILKR